MSPLVGQPPEPRREGFGWQVWSVQPLWMPHAHQHDEIEINLVRCGALEYLWGGELHRLETDQVGVFWGARLHRLLRALPGTLVTWVTLPSVRVQQFALPLELRTALWSRALLVAEEQATTAALFGQWERDPAGPDHEAIAELEVQAWLRRFALCWRVPAAVQLGQTGTGGRGEGGVTWDHALALARRVQQDFAQPLRVRALAAELGLHPNYVAGVFRRVFGVSLSEYITRCRLAQAQQLLISSELSVLEVALESGFGSSSRFFAAFRRRHGCSPRTYRQAHRHRGTEG